jgi:alpha-L-fucosidase
MVYEYDVPADAPERAWELCRGLGYSFCVNRNERVEDFLTAGEIVAMLVETVAKGGNLLLNVGPNADGSLPAIQERLLRDSGEWVRANADAIHGSTRFDVPGDGRRWYTRTGDIVHAFDLALSEEPLFAELADVRSVRAADGTELTFKESVDGVRVDARSVARHPLGTRYEVSCGRSRPIRVSVAAKTFRIADALATAQPGDVVVVPAGVFTDEPFPLNVPAGVTLKGAGAHATTIDAGGRIAVALQAGASLRGLTVTGGAPGYMMIPATCVTTTGHDCTVAECHVQSIMVNGGDRVIIERNVVAGGKIWCVGANDATIRGNYQHGLRWGAGIECNGGRGQLIEANECRDSLAAIKCTATHNVEIVRNRYETRWFGIHLLDAHNSRCYRNQAWHTMRAVNVEGGTGNRVEKQLAEHCDSGVMIEGGAEGTVVAESWLHDCRIGVFIWGAGTVSLEGNAISKPRDHEIVTDEAG